MARVFDPYLIPGTNVLRNLVGATDEDALAAAENDLCSARAAILREDLPSAEGTLGQLRRMHRFLFRDVYDWAGEVRTIDMGKGEGLPFQPLELFSIGVRYSEEVLRADDLLKGLGHDEFVKRLSVSYNNFNILHPFREGNGRTQRIFWEIIAREAGWHFDWGLIDKRTNDQASIAGMQRNDLRPLEDMFRRIVKPLSEPLTMSNDLAHLGEYAQPANTAYDMSLAQRRHVYEHYSYSVPSFLQGKESRNAGTRRDDFRMRRTRIHYLGIWFSVSCSFSIPVFRFFGIHRFRYPVG
ncbi:cell filamentation protein Fic [Bifidobacterium bifidum]|nr:cell filamentation protein Fic [Bifidobacterium bifidum]RGL61946.1 cell filamentation protein Fic [Bifidobacterium bifidum]